MIRTAAPRKPLVAVPRDLLDALDAWAKRLSPKSNATALVEHLLREALKENQK